MIDNQKLQAALTTLAPYRGQKGWKMFFRYVDSLETVESEIDDEMHNEPSDTTELEAEAKGYLQKLDNIKLKMQQQTAGAGEFEAVEAVVYELGEEFGYIDQQQD